MTSTDATLTKLAIHFIPGVNTLGGGNVLMRIKGVYFQTSKFELQEDGHLVISVCVDSQALASFKEQASEQAEITQIDEVA